LGPEDAVIDKVVRALPSAVGRGGEQFRLGIGDDAAILKQARGLDWVVSCDAFLEGVHFLSRTHPASSVGYKSLARATSDLAAMGAEPRFFLLTLALPAKQTVRWLDDFLWGMARAAHELGIRLLGGDTTSNDKVSLNVTVIGQIAGGRMLTRSGARPGDLIYVSGRLGAAKLGLDLVLIGLGRSRAYHPFTQQHLYPRIQVNLGRWLSLNRIASSAIDISDGFSTDLNRLIRAAGVGAIIQSERIPKTAVPSKVATRLERSLDPLEMALHGGDDYELLFTVPSGRAKRLSSAPGRQKLTCIGEVTQSRRILLVGKSGKTRPLKPRGWDSFRD